MSIFFEYLATRSGKALILAFKNEKYLFNCFEGFQRYSIESKIRLNQLTAVFLPTKISVVPFIGTYLTIGDMGKKELKVITQHRSILDYAYTFAHRKNCKLKFFVDYYKDSNIECKQISECNGFNIIVKIKNIRGKFKCELASDLGIPKQFWSSLCNKNIVEYNGKMYNGTDFLEKDQMFDEIAIIFSEDIEEKELEIILDYKIVICFNIKTYQKIFQRIVGVVYCLRDSINVEFCDAYKMQYELSKLCEYYHCPQAYKDDVIELKNYLDTKDLLYIKPKEEENIIKISVKHFFKEKSETTKLLEDGIIFLGTGSAIPSKYRNVSSILLIKNKKLILLDCGEDTLYNLNRIYGSMDVLKCIDLIYISHLHPDHNLGIISVINEIFKYKSDIKIIAPKIIGDFIKQFTDQNFEFYNTNDVKRECYKFNSHLNKLEDYIITYNFGYTVSLCPVNHTSDSVGIKIDFEDFSISYSGDCRPTPLFAQLSANVDVMIHEATFADELQLNAITTKHSTISEALGIYKNSNAKKLILTHFSQRYCKKINLKNVICATDFFRYDIKNHDEAKMLSADKYFESLE
ncbi:hypothetical protein COBT_000919 [Conglomerata obtusa]